MSAPSSKTNTRATPWSVLQLALSLVGGVLAVGVLGVLIALCIPFVRATQTAAAPPPPPAMEAVDWHDPGSSIYCLACHRNVAPAMGLLDVEHGHPQNVPLSEAQLAVVRELGTVAGPDDTLICMSCHKLGTRTPGPHMLAAPLKDSTLCEACHPGHYAQGTPHDLRTSAPDEQNRAGQTVAEGGPCSACHLGHRYAREFIRSPLDPDGRCLTCHQALHIAARHARTTNDHPESHCSACHDPHNQQYGAFLKLPIGELCVDCHIGYEQGLPGGMHPLGALSGDLPAPLVEAGAPPLNEAHQLTCVVCHDTHEASHPALLRLAVSDNSLCLTCHEDTLRNLSHTGQLPRHGQRPVLSETQQRQVAAWGRPVGAGGELLCVSCHKMHGSQPGAPLVTFAPQYGEACLGCHAAQATVLGTTHDLLVRFPDLPNAAGLTPRAAGTCSTCHRAHGPAREPGVTAADPAGACTTCHRIEGLAASFPVDGATHPDTACIDCHDPHSRTPAAYLRAPEPDLCAACHMNQMRLQGGPHDRTATATGWEHAPTNRVAVCLSCHVPHGGERPDLFRVATGQSLGMHDEVCLACHATEGWGAQSSLAALHPRDVQPEHGHVDVALVPTDEAGRQRLGCRTCHDPHGAAQPRHLARVAPGEPTETLCLHCHKDKELMRLTGHAPGVLAASGFDTDSCKPCHAMHAAPDAVYGDALSPRYLQEKCDIAGLGHEGCVPCLACHHAGGPAPVRDVFTHPEVVNFNLFKPEDPGYMPLFAASGKVDPSGQITCRTCHLSHGRVDLLELVAQEQTLQPEQLEGLRAQVRRFATPNICTNCHGDAGRVKYLFFHNAARRAGGH